MSIKDKVINEIIRVEGGYSNNPNDSGGETMYGITAAVAKRYGWTRPMNQLPKSFAYSIYSRIYWDSLLLDQVEKIYPEVAAKLADIGVNMGVGRAGEFLQRSLNVLNNQAKFYPDITVDGLVGGRTLNALKSYYEKRGMKGEEVLFRMLNCLQGAFYVSLAERRQKDESFIYGWFSNRIA